MAVNLKRWRMISILKLSLLACCAYGTQANAMKKEINSSQPILLAEKGLLESQYWRPVNTTVTPPARPTLTAEKLGSPINFCLSVDFTIKSDGSIADLKIKKTNPAGIGTEVTVADLQNMAHWQFEPTAENTQRQPVISNRVFNFKVNHRATQPDCFTN